ncbi:uncharacterized protein [Dermacentor albipictus]|uniref:uncharacterized protein n=1 Tax=Dermacentor albipictus TaxID=60249 RepID=UPI0038FCEE18
MRSPEQEVHKGSREGHRKSPRGSHRGSPAYRGSPAIHGSLLPDSAKTPQALSKSSKDAAEATPKREETKKRAKSPERKSLAKPAASPVSGSPPSTKVLSKSRRTSENSPNTSPPATSPHELLRLDRPSTLATPATSTHGQTTRPTIDFASENYTRRKRTRRSSSCSQAQETTELLTQSRQRLTSIILGLGAAVAVGVLVVLAWRLASRAWAARSSKTVASPGSNRSEVSEGHPSAFANCLDAGACESAYASLLRESIDTGANPCHNFYDYACGGWRRNHDTSTATRAWHQYAKDVMERLRVGQVSSRMRNEPVGQAVHFLETCLKGGRKADMGTETDVKVVLAEAGLTWPERSERSDFLNSLFFMARRVGLPVFFDVDSGYTKTKFRAIFFRLDATFQKIANRFMEMLKKKILTGCVRVMYQEFADGVANETRIDEIVRGLQTLATVVAIYLQASVDGSSVHDIASLRTYAPSVSPEMWTSTFRKFFGFDFAELNATVIYDVRSFSAVFQYVLDYGEVKMKDAFGFLSVIAAVSHTSSEIRDAFFGSASDASFRQEQYCFLTSYVFYGDALNNFLFEKARAELKTFGDLQEFVWEQFPRIVGPNSTLLGERQPLPRDNHLHVVSEFLRTSEPRFFLPRYKTYPNLTDSALRNWMALTGHKRQLGFAYTDSGKDSDCASQCDATIYKWRLTPYHLAFPWYSPGIHRGILFAGLGTRLAAATFLDYIDRRPSRRARVYDDNHRCLRAVNPELKEGPDIGLQAGVAAVLASSALLGGYARDFSLVDSGAGSLRDVGHLKGIQVFFAFGCHLLCGDANAERLCNVPLRHSVDFARAFNCEADALMNPSRKCRMRV